VNCTSSPRSEGAAASAAAERPPRGLTAKKQCAQGAVDVEWCSGSALLRWREEGYRVTGTCAAAAAAAGAAAAAAAAAGAADASISVHNVKATTSAHTQLVKDKRHTRTHTQTA